jgi:hypothetical protein
LYYYFPNTSLFIVIFPFSVRDIIFYSDDDDEEMEGEEDEEEKEEGYESYESYV